jgi:septal ring factor EnvC (AmiA/AmiB activator)
MMLHQLAIVLAAVVPVSGPVVRYFQPPACERCAGHRGVTLQTSRGNTVHAASNGIVEFAGSVGGTLYVVQRINPSVRVTYGGLATLATTNGAQLTAGDVVGLSAETTYLSVRVGDAHVEPLRALGLGRSRLVPGPSESTQIVGGEGLPR